MSRHDSSRVRACRAIAPARPLSIDWRGVPVRPALLAILFVLSLLLLATRLPATTLLPLSDQDLRARSTVIVEGVVLRVEPFESSRGFPETQTTIRVTQTFKGRIPGDLVVRDRGGVLPDGRWLKMFGRPDYVVGRRVLVFAVPHPDGQFQTAEFTLGKFEIWKDAAGRRFLARDLVTRSRDGIEFLSTSLAPAQDTLRDYDGFVQLLRTRRTDVESPAPPTPTGRLAPEEDASLRGVRPLWADWGGTLYRWNNGANASWVLSSAANLLTGGGYAEARAAIAEWRNHPTSTIDYSDGGVGASGANFIDLASTSVCGTTGAFCGGGVIGCGGPGGTSGTHTWRGDTYGTISWAHLEIRQTTGPSCVSSAVFAAAVTHELGHTLGFGHADQGASAHDTCRGDESLAQMRSSVQSRGTSLGTDDSDAARWVYGDGDNSCSSAAATPTPTATSSPIPPTATRTPTAAPPTPTRTPTAVLPTPTPTPTATPPTETPTPTPTSDPPTATPTQTPTEAPPTATPTPEPATPTPTPVPPSSSEPLRANFRWTPLYPRPGEAVSFTDLSTGAGQAWSWKFGNSASADGNFSALQNPVYVFSRESTFTVTLVVRDAAGNRSTRRQKVIVTNSSAAATTAGTGTIPVAGHVQGIDGRTFLTDVQIENPGDGPATARLSFQPHEGEAPEPVAIDLGARETVNVSDAVLELFRLSDSLGAMRLDWAGAPAPLRMASRTYTRHGDGTLGQAAAAFGALENPRASRFVTGLARTESFRTNLGAVNDSEEFESFQIVLLGRNGEVLGESSAVGLGPRRQTQLSIADLFPAAGGKGMTAEIRPIAGSRAPFAYAAVVDNYSGDPTFYPAAVPARALYLPAVARITGYDDAFFSSEVSIANAGSETAWVQVSFLEHDRDNSQARSVVFTVAPHETLQVDDVLGSLFHVSETYGALAVESSDFAKLVVSARIFTASANGAGTVGQQVDAIPDEGFFSRGSILGLRQDSAFRSNVGLFNPEPFWTTVTLTLRRADGSPIGEARIAVPPLGYVQRNLAVLFPGAEMRDSESLTLSIQSSDVDVFAFAAVIDNVSQDPTFSPGLN
jgi:PKD repeat protein